jgi:SPP1 gp7 family putative phage head morphogenesis protein
MATNGTTNGIARRTERTLTPLGFATGWGDINNGDFSNFGFGRVTSFRDVLGRKPRLTDDLTGPLPISEIFSRIRWGRSLDLETIEGVIRTAWSGVMAPASELIRESLQNSPAVASMIGRRIDQVAGAPWEVTPAQETGEDKDARRVCDVVRRVLRRASNFDDLLWDTQAAVVDGRAGSQVDWTPVVGDSEVRWQPASYTWIHPGRLSFGPQRELRVVERHTQTGLYYAVGPALQEIPGKFVTHHPRVVNDYPERDGLWAYMLYWLFFERFGVRYMNELIELYAKGWRKVTGDGGIESHVSPDAVQEGAERAQALGGETDTVWFAPGVDMEVLWPSGEGWQLLRAMPTDVREVLAWLILGQSKTTDGDTYGKGGEVLSEQQELIKVRDARRVCGTIKRAHLEHIVRLNVSPNAVHLTPDFVLRVKSRKDEAAQQERLSVAIKDGLKVGVGQYREEAGIREVKEGEAFLVLDKTATGDPRGRVIDPSDPSFDEKREQEIGQIVPPPEMLADALTVNQVLAAAGWPGLRKPGSDTPDPDGDLKWNEFIAKGAKDKAAAVAAGQGKEKADPGGAPPAPPGGLGPRGKPGAAGGPKPPAGKKPAARKLEGALHEAILLDTGASHLARPELAIRRGLSVGQMVTTRWCRQLSRACEGLSDEGAIRRALDAAAEDLDENDLAPLLERTMVRSLMVGAVDAHEDAAAEEPWEQRVAADALLLGTIGPGGGVVDFLTRPFKEAIDAFRKRKVVDNATFGQLRGDARRRSFTVAGLATKTMLQTAKDELGKALEAGTDLRAFRERLDERMTSAGWTTLKPSHTEVVFRNAGMGAYASGRHAQMTQPAVLAARPYWMVRGVDDGRTRPNHRAMHGKVFPAGDKVWDKGRPPWGHNCRCSLVSLSPADMKRRGLTASTAAAHHGVPDDGWDDAGHLG